jgi:hypothetical protein
MRRWLIAFPTRIVDAAIRGYEILLAAVAIVTLTTAALWALLWFLGSSLP